MPIYSTFGWSIFGKMKTSASGPDFEHDLSTLSLQDMTACHECDLLMSRPRLDIGGKAICPRCGYELYTRRRGVVQRSLALVLTALLLFIPANFLPIMHLSLLGLESQDTIWSAVLSLTRNGMPEVAALVFLCSMGVPLAKLLCQLFVLLSIVTNIGKGYGLLLYRTYHHLRDWGMLEVYLLGILVSIVKLGDIADLNVGLGLGCFVGLLLVQVALEVVMSPHQIWEALSRNGVDEGD